MYIREIIAYLMWPAMIVLSYWLVRVALRRFDKVRARTEAPGD